MDKALVLKQLWLPETGSRYQRKPGKLYFDNTSLLALLANEGSPDYRGTARETFAVNQLSTTGKLALSTTADLLDADGRHFEIGGAAKSARQLPAGQPGFLLTDGIDIGSANRIPLFLVGFLY